MGSFSRTVALLGFLMTIACVPLAGCGQADEDAAGSWSGSASTGAGRDLASNRHGAPTFTRDIAPVVFQQCASCHRPGESAPFALLTYEDVREHADQIADVVQRRYMPPWFAEPGGVEYVGERRLTDEEIALFERWAKAGAPEGNPSDLPELPKWTEGWQLGEPDLVIEMPEPFTVPAEGLDIYRNFVLPIPNNERKYVRAIELRPDNLRVAHHALMRIDQTPSSRRLDEQDAEPGFPGMSAPESAQSPDGHFMSWQPGRTAMDPGPGLSWRLDPGADLVLQMHLQPVGKPEPFSAKIGFYFADQPPVHRPYKLMLRSMDIDIPAGMKDYTIEDSYELPVEVDVLSIFPHAHYLGKRLEAYAQLPDGGTQQLLLIKNWDFNWQGEYRLKKPVTLPAGSVLRMRFSYDNSAENIRNPNNPPQRVRYGLNSTDEMGELWLQVLPKNQDDRTALELDFRRKALRDVMQRAEITLREDPGDPLAHLELGKGMLVQGKKQEAVRHFQAALASRPDYDEAHYNLGALLLMSGQVREAEAKFRETLRHNPEYGRAHGYLGMIAMAGGRLDEAAEHLREALRIQETDPVAHQNLALVYVKQGKLREALAELERSHELNPDNPEVRKGLEQLRRVLEPSAATGGE